MDQLTSTVVGTEDGGDLRHRELAVEQQLLDNRNRLRVSTAQDLSFLTSSPNFSVSARMRPHRNRRRHSITSNSYISSSGGSRREPPVEPTRLCWMRMSSAALVVGRASDARRETVREVHRPRLSSVDATRCVSACSCEFQEKDATHTDDIAERPSHNVLAEANGVLAVGVQAFHRGAVASPGGCGRESGGEWRECQKCCRAQQGAQSGEKCWWVHDSSKSRDSLILENYCVIKSHLRLVCNVFRVPNEYHLGNPQVLSTTVVIAHRVKARPSIFLNSQPPRRSAEQSIHPSSSSTGRSTTLYQSLD